MSASIALAVYQRLADALQDAADDDVTVSASGTLTPVLIRLKAAVSARDVIFSASVRHL